METESVRTDTVHAAREIAQYLDELGASRVIALDISAHSGFADCFVIAGAESQGQLQGYQRKTDEKLRELDLSTTNHRRRTDDSGWLLIDCGAIIVHLMLQEQRDFYDLERLWYDATVIWRVDPKPAAENAAAPEENQSE